MQDRFESISIKGEVLLLLPEKAIYWVSKKMLLISDLHLGKTTHFRNNGIAVPTKTTIKNWEILHQLFKKYQPLRVCFLGDLFHSVHNKEWEAFEELIQQYHQIQFELVLGNHDILNPQHYQNLGLKVSEIVKEKPFILTHEPIEYESSFYNLAGHIHPGVRLEGRGRQGHRLACFYFGVKGGLLPAFGTFTGMARIPITKDDKVFVVTRQEVIAIELGR